MNEFKDFDIAQVKIQMKKLEEKIKFCNRRLEFFAEKIERLERGNA